MTLETIVSAPVVRPVIVGYLDFADDPAFGWTGNGIFAPVGTGDPILDNNQFAPVDSAIDISSITENTENGGPLTLKFNAHDLDTEVIRQIVRDRRDWQLRRVKIWQFFMEADQATVSNFFLQRFSGVMVQSHIDRDHNTGTTITIECDTDLRGGNDGPARLLDHSRFYPADKFATFLPDLVRGSIASTPSMPTGGYYGPAGGPGRNLKNDWR